MPFTRLNPLNPRYIHYFASYRRYQLTYLIIPRLEALTASSLVNFYGVAISKPPLSFMQPHSFRSSQGA